MEKIGVVTITYNSEHVLDDFLDSVFNQTYSNFYLYIIDNSSKDDTNRILLDIADSRLRIKNNDTNIGVAAANNQGIRLALGEGCSHILLLNNDVIFEENLFEKMLLIHQEKKCSLLSPKIKYFSNSNLIWYAGSSFVKLKGFLPIHFGMGSEDYGQFDVDRFVQYAPTCCLSIKKEVFNDVGFMDEKYFVYFDDTDFLFRVLKHGKHSLYYFSDVNFYHKVGSLTRSFEFKNKNTYRGDFFIKQNIKNHVYFLKKIGTLYAYFYIVLLFFKNNLRIIINNDIKCDIKTWILINKSYFQGIRM